jgi:hypothetical protein
VWEAVWDNGLDGVGEDKYGSILLELYRKADVMDIARQDKLKVRISNQSITGTLLINGAEQGFQRYKDAQGGAEDAGHVRRECLRQETRRAGAKAEGSRGRSGGLGFSWHQLCRP